jgi:hypothetical protein
LNGFELVKWLRPEIKQNGFIGINHLTSIELNKYGLITSSELNKYGLIYSSSVELILLTCLKLFNKNENKVGLFVIVIILLSFIGNNNSFNKLQYIPFIFFNWFCSTKNV